MSPCLKQVEKWFVLAGGGVRCLGLDECVGPSAVKNDVAPVQRSRTIALLRMNMKTKPEKNLQEEKFKGSEPCGASTRHGKLNCSPKLYTQHSSLSAIDRDDRQLDAILSREGLGACAAAAAESAEV